MVNTAPFREALGATSLEKATCQPPARQSISKEFQKRFDCGQLRSCHLILIIGIALVTTDGTDDGVQRLPLT
jgi:hypothetical protein